MFTFIGCLPLWDNLLTEHENTSCDDRTTVMSSISNQCLCLMKIHK